MSEKLQQLRRQRNMTQEELAGKLFVSRTAVSKWESGRGYPNIDSLKAISKEFSVSIDHLLSGEELMVLAESEQKETRRSMRDRVFGILDCMASLLFFLPLYGQTFGDRVAAVPLLSYTDAREHSYVFYIYVFAVGLCVLHGFAQLILQNCRKRTWLRVKTGVSLVLSVFLILFTMANRQPYPGVLLLFLLIAKGAVLIKKS